MTALYVFLIVLAYVIGAAVEIRKFHKDEKETYYKMGYEDGYSDWMKGFADKKAKKAKRKRK